MPPSPERAAPKASEPAQDSGQLEDLNEGQLKALLDEAVNYKRPKDREGKSNLFKNLLHEAEQDEYLHGRTSICGTSSGGASGKRGRVKRSLATFPHSGSLQDLAGAGTGPDTRVPRPQTRHRRTVPVSQRSYHGGSLPANVDQQNFGVTENRHSFLEDVRYGSGVSSQIGGGGDYIATVRCVNPPPLGSSDSSSDHMVLRVAANENERVPSPPARSIVSSPQSTYSTTAAYYDDDGTEMELISSHKIPHIPCYTTRKTLEIASSSMTGDSAADRGIAFSLIDTNHGCISSPVVCQSQAVSALETKPLQLGSTYSAVRSVTDGGPGSNVTAAFPVTSQLNVINFLQPQPHHFIDSDKNVNSIGGQHAKKTKRKKLVKKETAILAELIEGHLGHIDNIDFLVEFIESGVENIAQTGKYQSKSTSDVGINGKVSSSQDKKYDTYDKSNKKRSTERRLKDGKIDSKIKRANSMEELSHRKLDDLTTTTKDTSSLRKSKKSSGVQAESNTKPNERRSWCNDVYSESYFKPDKSNETEATSSLDSATASSLTGKNNKKAKPSEIDSLDCDPFYNIETSDFQTVTKKKKIRKKHGSSDENQNRHNHSGNNNLHGCKIVFGGRSMHERDTIYKRLGHGSRPSASSPPSDKSNDSNDDLDSVHSLPADASGERLQASYADMARAAPPASPPPPPPPPPAVVARQRNFPDLIESCNYYSYDILSQEMENTKNLLLKNYALLDSDKNKVIKINSIDTDHGIHKAYSREQYPALDSRQKNDKLKSKVDNKIQNKSVNQTSDKKNKIIPNKCLKDEVYLENCSVSSFEDVNSNEYINFSKINMVNVNESFNPKMIKYHPGKIDGLIYKPPDVVLPIAEMAHSIDNRPAVIIMNEELNRNSDNVYNIDGITFGFDINEQLINGDSGCVMEDSSNAIDISACANGLNSSDLSNSPNIIYNSTIDFPAINEKPFREYNDKAKNNEDFKHSKKSNRASNKDAAKFNSKNNEELHADSKSNEPTCNGNKEEEPQGVAVVEARIGRDRALRYIAPTTTSKDIYNLDKIVHYVGMAWDDIIKSSGDKVCYFSEKQ